MKTRALAFLFCTLALSSFGASFRDDFAVVFIDEATEAKLGAFPLDRSLIAKAVRQSADQRAKAVVLKFFFDQPKTEAGDRALASSLTNLPVALQARIDDNEPQPNPLPDRFALAGVDAKTGVSGRSGWIPLPMLIEKATQVGFVDFASIKVPLLETYQSRTFKSLVVCCIEMATEKPFVIGSNRRMNFGTRGLQMDSRNVATAKLPARDTLDYIPFHEFLAGGISTERIQRKVVIIGYDGPKIDSIPTSIGPVRAHRLFVYELRSLYEQLAAKDL